VKYVQQHYDEVIDGAELQAGQLIEDATTRAAAIIADADAHVEAWEAEKVRLACVQQFQPKVKLDVGGTKHSTSLTTLHRFPDTMIGAMFSGRHALPLDDEGYHFIDRDGTHFRLILNFLRSPETFVVDLTGSALKELKSECEYYGIDELMFPFKPISPFVLQNVHISQDDHGIFFVNNDALRVCPHCHSASYLLPGTQLRPHVRRYLANFKSAVASQGGVVTSNQPKPSQPCQCGR